MPATPLMTPVRRTTLAIGLPVVLILITLAGYAWVRNTVIFLATQNEVGYSVGFSVPTDRGPVRVHSSNGNLTVSPGTGRRIMVHGRLSGSFVRPTFSHTRTAYGLNLNPQCHVPAGNCSLNLGLTVPAGLPVSISESFGTLDARGLRGPVVLWDSSGDLTASRLTGNVHLSDNFGAITASGLAGSIRLDNNSGDIQADGVTGDTRLQDSFGTISVTGLAAADVVARNSSGDISLTFTKVPRQVTVTDSFGNITLVLPAGATSYRVATRNSFGSTTVSVPRSATARNVITASNNSGDITITTQKHPAVAHPPSAGPSPPGGPSPPA
jgi:Putative adhesin